MAKDRFVNEKLLVQELPVLFRRQDGKPLTEADLNKMTDFIEENMILKRASEIEKVRRRTEDGEPSKEEVEIALKTINDIAVIVSMHGMYQTPVPGLVATTTWLKKRYDIKD